MSDAFSSFNNLTRNDMNRRYGLQYMKDKSLKYHVTKLSGDFVQRLFKIQQWWNLDRSEDTRRTWVDAFLYESILKTQQPTLIITAAENIPSSNNTIGHGYLDYILSLIDAQTKMPIYTPSIVIETKKSITLKTDQSYDGENQLLAEMITLHQIKKSNTDLMRGILTDGRQWIFYEMNMTGKTVYRTTLYDIGDDLINNDEPLRKVIGILNKFISEYNSRDMLIH